MEGRGFLLPVIFHYCTPYLGEALSRNPGYIKLRKIRAAQNISKTVSRGAQNFHVSSALALSS